MATTMLHVMLVVLLRILSVLKGAWDLSRALGGKTQYKRLQRSSGNVQLAVSTVDSALDKSITKLGHYTSPSPLTASLVAVQSQWEW